MVTRMGFAPKIRQAEDLSATRVTGVRGRILCNIYMILSAEMKLKASLMRKESRCSHYRLDYPDMDDDNWQAWINIYKGADGSMQFEKQAFGSWPVL